MNLIQTIRESDALRVDLKRVVCLVDAHRAHYVDLRVGTEDERVYYADMEPYIDSFLWGLMSHTELLRVAWRPPAPDRELQLARRVAWSLNTFGVEFMKKLVRHALTTPPNDDE